MEANLKELKDAISSGSTQSVKDEITSLNQVVVELGQSLYSQSRAPGAGPAEGGANTESTCSTGKAADGDVIDADFTESRLYI